MKFSTYIFLGQCIILLNEHKFRSVKAMIGHNIRQAQSGDYSFIASIMRIEPGHPNSNGSHFCTGIIITRKDVLTSAHCLETELIVEIQIVIGTINLRNGTVYYPFWWITYDQWAVMNNIYIDSNINDLANIRLLLSVPDRILPARISRLENNELYGADVIIAGWGMNNDNIVPEIMNVATVKIIENHICERKIERLTGIRIPMTMRVFCTSAEPFVLVNIGDSGGPLLFRNRLIAITTGTIPLNRDPPIYDRQMNLHIAVNYYRIFINSIKNV